MWFTTCPRSRNVAAMFVISHIICGMKQLDGLHRTKPTLFATDAVMLVNDEDFRKISAHSIHPFGR